MNENTRFLIYIKRDLYSERKYNVCNIYRKRFLQQTKIQDS